MTSTSTPPAQQPTLPSGGRAWRLTARFFSHLDDYVHAAKAIWAVHAGITTQDTVAIDPEGPLEPLSSASAWTAHLASAAQPVEVDALCNGQGIDAAFGTVPGTPVDFLEVGRGGASTIVSVRFLQSRCEPADAHLTFLTSRVEIDVAAKLLEDERTLLRSLSALCASLDAVDGCARALTTDTLSGQVLAEYPPTKTDPAMPIFGHATYLSAKHFPELSSRLAASTSLRTFRRDAGTLVLPTNNGLLEGTARGLTDTLRSLRATDAWAKTFRDASEAKERQSETADDDWAELPEDR